MDLFFLRGIISGYVGSRKRSRKEEVQGMAGNKKAQELDQKLRRTERQLTVLQKISRLMTRRMSLPEVLKAIVDLVEEATKADACLIYLMDED